MGRNPSDRSWGEPCQDPLVVLDQGVGDVGIAPVDDDLKPRGRGKILGDEEVLFDLSLLKELFRGHDRRGRRGEDSEVEGGAVQIGLEDCGGLLALR